MCGKFHTPLQMGRVSVIISCQKVINASTVICKVFIESTPTLLNQPQRKFGHSCANSWHKIDRYANTWRAFLKGKNLDGHPLQQLTKQNIV